MPRSTPALTIGAVCQGMRAVGIDTARVFRRINLDPAVLREMQRPIYDPSYDLLWEEAHQGRAESIAAEIGAAVPFGAMGPVDYLGASAATVGDALRCLRDFSHLMTDESYWEFETTQQTWVIRLVNFLAFEWETLSDEFALALLLDRLGRSVPRPLEGIEVRLRRSTPSAEVRARFRARVSFGHARSEIVLPSSTVQVALASADVHLHHTMLSLLHQAGNDARPLPPMVGRVRSQARALLSHNCVPQLPVLAHQLGVSQRTLQRRLSEEGTELGQVLDELRRDLAIIEVRSGRQRTLLEVALSLGFADDRSFARAFRRWTGQSPSEWRAHHAPLLDESSTHPQATSADATPDRTTSLARDVKY